jgi:hypothetical protein
LVKVIISFFSFFCLLLLMLRLLLLAAAGLLTLPEVLTALTANWIFSSADSSDLHTCPGTLQHPVDWSHWWMTNAGGK